MKKNRNRNRRKILVGAGMFTMISVVFAITILFNAQVTEPIVENEIIIEYKKAKSWNLQPLRDADPGTNTTGFQRLMYYPHQADATTYYNTNRSNSSAYEFADCVNCSMTGETPYSTAFDIVYYFQVSRDDGYNVTAGDWDNSITRVYLNETTLSISGENLTEIVRATGYYERYYAYVSNNSGSGYQIGKGVHLNCSYKHEIYG